MTLDFQAKLFDYMAMNLELHSQRLALTPYSMDDLDLSLLIWTDPDVVRYAGGILSESAVKKNMHDRIKRGGDGYIGIWTVADRETGEKYGSVALLPMPVEDDHTDYDLVAPGKVPAGDIEIGYFFKRSAWGFGYATEACRRLLQFAFQETPLQEVVATFDKENLASKNVLLKAGFTDRGTMRCYGSVGLNFRITRDEWSRSQST